MSRPVDNVQTANPTLAYGAIAAGVLGIIAGIFVPLAGWILGAVGLVLGFLSYRRPATAKLGQIAMAIGFVAILVGVYFFTSAIA